MKHLIQIYFYWDNPILSLQGLPCESTIENHGLPLLHLELPVEGVPLPRCIP